MSVLIRSENEGYYLIRELFRKTTIDIGEEVNEIYVYIRDEGMIKMKYLLSKNSGSSRTDKTDSLIAWHRQHF